MYKDTYPLLTCMVPPLKKQNQLLPHYLVSESEQLPKISQYFLKYNQNKKQKQKKDFSFNRARVAFSCYL